MPYYKSTSKVGVYIDLSNMYFSAGRDMQFDILREFAARDGAEIMRLNAYGGYDSERAVRDSDYSDRVGRFHAALRDYGYKVILKEVKWYMDDNGNRVGKANADLDLAVDMLLESARLDRVVLVSGDGDFTRAVRALQNKGCRVEVVAFNSVSSELRHEADMFMSGYLIPNLLPTEGNRNSWGEPGSRVRGVCYFHKEDYGFFRFMKTISPEIWLTDSRRPDSPFEGVYFRDGDLPREVSVERLPSHNHYFEFTLEPTDRPGSRFRAEDVRLVGKVPE